MQRASEQSSRSSGKARLNYFDRLYDRMTRKSTGTLFKSPHPFPLELHVELTNKCNLKCPFCPTGNKTMKRPGGFMREDLWWAICTEAKEHDTAIRLIRFGEPTLHVRCFDYIRMAKRVGLKVHLNTNGVGLDVKEVLDSGLDSIKISVHNHAAVKPLRRLLKARGQSDFTPYITVGELDSEDSYGLKGDSNQVGKTVDLKHGYRCPKSCWELYNRLSINWDGRVVACCGSYNNQMTIGSIYDKDTLKEVWEGDALHRYREMEQKQMLDNVPLCSKCAR